MRCVDLSVGDENAIKPLELPMCTESASESDSGIDHKNTIRGIVLGKNTQSFTLLCTKRV